MCKKQGLNNHRRRKTGEERRWSSFAFKLLVLETLLKLKIHKNLQFFKKSYEIKFLKVKNNRLIKYFAKKSTYHNFWQQKKLLPAKFSLCRTSGEVKLFSKSNWGTLTPFFKLEATSSPVLLRLLCPSCAKLAEVDIFIFSTIE